jgi:hypothetical protein
VKTIFIFAGIGVIALVVIAFVVGQTAEDHPKEKQTIAPTTSIPTNSTAKLPVLTSKLTAISRTAESITGDIGYSTDNTMTILNKSYPSRLVRELKGRDVEDVARMFSIDPPAADSSALRALYRMDIPATDKLVNGDTICGDDDVHWVVYMSSDDNLNIWNVAFFSGDSEPNLQTQTNLCVTFRYRL